MLARAGFEPWQGRRPDARRAPRYLVGHFTSECLRGFWAWSTAASVIAAPLAAAAWVVGRVVAPSVTQVADFGVAPGTEQVFAVETLGYLFTATVSWAVFFVGLFVAPQLSRDMRSGALLLYFCRPLERRAYLAARLLAPAIILQAGFVLGATILVPVLGNYFGWAPPAPHPPATGVTITGGAVWPAAWALFVLSGGFVAVALPMLALASSVLSRAAGQASLIFFSVVAGSAALGWAARLSLGEHSLARAVDLVRGLEAAAFFAFRLVDPAEAPDFAKLTGAIGMLAWLVLASSSFWLVHRAIMAPPSSRERP